MYTFLKAEWKTIVVLLIFCGGIYAWFYAEEVRKEELKNKPYTFECLRSGEGILSYKLGTSVSALQAEIQGFQRTEDAPLGLVRYERPDGAFILNFRHDILVSVEFYPEKTESIAACVSDIAKWKDTYRMIAEPIQTEDLENTIYEGMVQIQRVTKSDENTVIKEPYGWIAVPKTQA